MMRRRDRPSWKRQYLAPDRYGPMRALIVCRRPRRQAHAAPARLRLVPADSCSRVLHVGRGTAPAKATGPPHVA